MPSHDIRITVEHYPDGGFGVMGYNNEKMGLSTIRDVKDAVEDILILEFEELVRREKIV